MNKTQLIHEAMKNGYCIEEVTVPQGTFLISVTKIAPGIQINKSQNVIGAILENKAIGKERREELSKILHPQRHR